METLHKRIQGRSSLIGLFSYAEFAAAVELVVEIVLFKNLVTTLLQAAFSPVLVPPDDLVIWWDIFCPQSAEADSPLGHADIDFVIVGRRRCGNVLRTSC